MAAPLELPPHGGPSGLRRRALLFRQLHANRSRESAQARPTTRLLMVLPLLAVPVVAVAAVLPIEGPPPAA